MKGIKLYALLGSLSLMAVCVPQMTLADEPASQPASSAGEKKFNEADAAKGHDRQLTLDQIMMMHGAQKASDAGTKADSHSQRQVSLDQLFPKNYSQSATDTTVIEHHKAPSAHTNPKQPVMAKAPAAKAGGKSALAVYKHTPSESDAVVAVAHQVISHGSTGVITASLDRPGTVPQYKSGDHMVINLKALQDCNVLVFDYDNNGTITQLWPNAYEPNGKLSAGETVQVGGESSQYTLDIDGKGLEQIFIYAYPSSEKMPGLLTAMAPVEHTPFRAAHMTTAQYHRLMYESKEYFQPAVVADNRGVVVTGKPNRQIGASNASFSDAPANKVELTFQIEK
jgi:hypothetical protein